MWCAIIKSQETNKDKVHDCKHHQRFQNRPKITDERTLITQFKIRFNQFLK